MSRSIDYGNLMHAAMRGLIQNVLANIAREGLPGEHHFFISFDTSHADVELADWLSDRFPDDMTIVVQHWFENLDVGDEGFAITLNFGDQPERMFIPYDAIRTFVDPSVEFGLRFESQDKNISGNSEAGPVKVVKNEVEVMEVQQVKAPKAKKKGKGKDKAVDAEIVSLDSFRK